MRYIILKLFKVSEKASIASHELIKNIFSQVVNDNDLTLAYGYTMKSGFFTKKIASFILGLTKDQHIFYILQFDINSNEAAELITLRREDITSAKRNLQGSIVIASPKLKRKFSIIIPPFSDKLAENTYRFPINQEKEEKVFRSFFGSIK